MANLSSNPVATFRPGHRLVDKVAVIGAGAMGAGIAAQFANGGIPVTLLDLPSEGEDRAALARNGVQNQLKAGGFMRPDLAELVSVGTTEDLDLLSDADLIIEAVIERLDVKQDLFRRVEAVRKDGSIVASNTSTLPREAMAAGLPERFASDFIILHFFNPPRHMRLVELVGGPETSRQILERATRVCEVELGKTVVAARDTPGFIANRIGCYWMAACALEAIERGLDVETADAIVAAVAGAPRTGVFGLFDLIGIDLVPHIWGSLHAALPDSDILQSADIRRSEVFQDMLENHRFGRKTKGGFYRLAADRSKEVWDYQTRTYRPERIQPKYGRDLLDVDTAEGAFARAAVAKTAGYVAAVSDEIADSPKAIDDAMMLGYAWTQGPFHLAEQVGQQRILSWLAAGGVEPLPKFPERAQLASLPQPRSVDAELNEPGVAALFDLGDGIALLELGTKMNVFSEAVFDAVTRAIRIVGDRYTALVLTGAGERAFSAGADLSRIRSLAETGDWDAIDRFIEAGQATLQKLRFASFPVVGAAFGLALGGGCESLMHCDAVVAHAELTAGLPETKVGILPGWGGCTHLLARGLSAGHTLEDAASLAFDAIVAGRISSSALDAASFGVLKLGDEIAMNRTSLLDQAKALALSLAPGYRTPVEFVLPVGGSALAERLLSRLDGANPTEHDRLIAGRVAHVLSGGDAQGQLTEMQMMRLERLALMELARPPKTQDRIAHMLMTGKPLRN